MVEKNKPDNDNVTGLTNSSTQGSLDVDGIYKKIAPYLSEPEFIKDLLKSHSQVTREQLLELIEQELKDREPIESTDLRILHNSL